MFFVDRVCVPRGGLRAWTLGKPNRRGRTRFSEKLVQSSSKFCRLGLTHAGRPAGRPTGSITTIALGILLELVVHSTVLHTRYCSRTRTSCTRSDVSLRWLVVELRPSETKKGKDARETRRRRCDNIRKDRSKKQRRRKSRAYDIKTMMMMMMMTTL
jgi:hypothetical protein